MCVDCLQGSSARPSGLARKVLNMFDVLHYQILGCFQEPIDARDREFKKGLYFLYYIGSDQLELEVGEEDFKNPPAAGSYWLFRGDLKTKSGRIQLQQRDVVEVKDPEAVWNDAYKLGGLVEGTAFLQKNPYFNDAGETVPLCEVRALGFQVRSTFDKELYQKFAGGKSYGVSGALVNALRNQTRGEDRYKVNEWQLAIHRVINLEKKVPNK